MSPAASFAKHSFAVRLPRATAYERIGLLGGSFNPAHDGHRLISEIARKRLSLNQIWWIVSPGNPLKRHDQLASLNDRMATARRIAGHRRIIVTSFEAALGSPYTVDTLAFLNRRHPRVKFVWLMGADNLVQLPRWRNWQRIFSMMPIAIVDRPGWHLKAHASKAAQIYARQRVVEARASRLFDAPPPRWTLLTGPLSSQSSTAIRAARNG